MLLALAIAASAAFVPAASSQQAQQPKWVFAEDYATAQLIGSQNIFSFNLPCTALPNNGSGTPFFAFGPSSAPFPLWIQDPNPALSEIIHPNSTTVTGAGCSFSATAARNHPSFTIRSGTYGLQEALTALAKTQAVEDVFVGTLWYSGIKQLPGAPSGVSLITSVKGTTNVQIVDTSQSPWVWYAWNGTQYQQISMASAPPALAVQFQCFVGSGFCADSSFNVNTTTKYVSALALNGTLNEQAFPGSTVSQRITNACSSVSNPQTTFKILVPSTETDQTAVTSPLSNFCQVQDERGLWQVTRFGTTSLCTPGGPGCPGGSVTIQKSTSANPALATNLYAQQVIEMPESGGVNTFQDANGIDEVTASGTGSGYTSGPATLSGGTSTQPAEIWCIAVGGQVQSPLYIQWPGAYSVAPTVTCPSGSGQTFTPILGRGAKSNYVALFAAIPAAHTPGQHFVLEPQLGCFSPGDCGILSANIIATAQQNAAGDQGINPISLVTVAGTAPMTGTVAAINGNVLTICGSSAMTGAACNVAPTNGNQLGELHYLVNTSRNVYSTGSISGIAGAPPVFTGSGTSWGSLGSTPFNPANLFIEMTGEPTVAGVASATYVSGGTFSGTGTVRLVNFNGCSSTIATMAVSGGVAGAISIKVAGTGCTAAPTTATCSTGTISCSGTVTLTSTLGAGGGAHQVLQVQTVTDATHITAWNQYQADAQLPYGGYYTGGGAYNIYQGSIITGVPDAGNTFTTVYAQVGDPTQYQVGDTVMDPGGNFAKVATLEDQITQNVPIGGSTTSFNESHECFGPYSCRDGESIEGNYSLAPITIQLQQQSIYGIELTAPSPSFGFFNGFDPSGGLEVELTPLQASTPSIEYDPRGAGATAGAWIIAQAGGTTSSAFLGQNGNFSVGETPVAGVSGAFNGTVLAGAIGQNATKDFGGSCSMVSGTTCTVPSSGSLSASYGSTPSCTVSEQGSSSLVAAGCTVGGSNGAWTIAVTAASSNSATWWAELRGNPN